MEVESNADSKKVRSDSPALSVAASDSSSTRPNKRKRKCAAPTRHIQPSEVIKLIFNCLMI